MLDWFIVIIILGIGTCLAQTLNFIPLWLVTLSIGAATQILVNYIRNKQITSIRVTKDKLQDVMTKIETPRTKSIDFNDFMIHGKIPVRVDEQGVYYINAVELSKVMEYVDAAIMKQQQELLNSIMINMKDNIEKKEDKKDE